MEKHVPHREGPEKACAGKKQCPQKGGRDHQSAIKKKFCVKRRGGGKMRQMILARRVRQINLTMSGGEKRNNLILHKSMIN